MRRMVTRRLVLVLVVLFGAVGCGGSTPRAAATPSPALLGDCVAASASTQLNKTSGPVRYETLTVRRVARDYRIFRPPTLDNAKPVPLVIVLHGSPLDAAGFEDIIQFDAEASAGGFMAVYPDGCDEDWDEIGSKDVEFISHLIDKLESEFQIDRSRVYVTGASAGALMGYRLACDLANRIAAFASITGSMYWNDCQPARPISILEMHGTADTHSPYDGGRSTRNNKILPAVTAVNQRWLGLDGCTGEPVLSQSGITKTSVWKGCSGGTMVRLDTIVGGHHTWFGSNFDPVPGEPDSNTAVWNFLRQFVLADAATQRYLTLVEDYWNGLQAADVVANGSNVAAKVCLGNASPTAPTNMSLIDPATCKQRAAAILAVQEKFLSGLDTTPAPPRFGADDRVFRTQIPKAISDVKAMIAACDTGNKQTIRDASAAYVDDMIPTVSGALDDVDPTVVHM